MSAPASAPLSDAAFGRIAAIAMADAGIVLPEAKRDMVRSRLARRVRALGADDFEAYCDWLEREEAHPERRELINALTTNVTRFMREPHHFEELRKDVLPKLCAEAARGSRIRLWSAGCSSGEEPITIAVNIAAGARQLLNADCRILASDIDEQILSQAKAARYPASALEGFPKTEASSYFTIADDVAAPKPEIRDLIAYKRLNLIEKWPMRGPFQVIFCRNVLIYFDAETQYRIIRGFAEILAPGGALFLGHSERVDQRLEHLFERAGMTSYRRVAGASR